MPRLELDKEKRKLLFFELKSHYSSKSFKELSKHLGVGFGTLKKWQYGKLTTPSKIVPQEILNKISVSELKDDNWGAAKGGSISIRKIFRKYPKKVIAGWRHKGGKATWRIAQAALRKIKRNEPEKFSRILREKKTMKRLAQIKEGKFEEKKIFFNIDTIELSKNDIKRGITFPSKLTEELAEEIGMHLGDGTLSKNKHYYSIRGDIKEKKYYENHVIPLYKKLYNLDLRLLERQPICGIELSSKGLFEFKNKIIGIPFGEKTGKLSVPNCIKQSQSKKIFAAFLRGMMDTDGCFYMPSTRKYPSIILCIKSQKLIKEASTMLKQMGFLPNTNIKYCLIILNGAVMFNKWVEEIGTKNEKHLHRINNILSKLPWSSLDKTPAREAGNLGSNPSGSALQG